MNKLMIFPLAFMLILTIFSVVDTGETYSDYSEDFSGSGDTIYINGSSASSGTVDIPSAGSQEIDLWIIAGAVAILFIAIGIGTVAGINVLGTGLSEFSQSLIFQSILFVGLWTALTIIVNEYVFVTVYTQMIWLMLTIAFVIGIGQQMTNAGTGAD